MQSQNNLLSIRFQQNLEGNDFKLGHCFDSALFPADFNSAHKEIKKRNRKNQDQIKLLVGEFEENPVWSKETLFRLSEKTGLSQAQIYKWNWEYKKKQRRCQRVCNEEKLVCSERLAPLQFESDLLVVQRLYKIKFTSGNNRRESD